MAPDAVRMRRDLHRHPEIAWTERRTTYRIAEALTAHGLEPVVRHDGIGLLVEVGSGRPIVGFRADIDALPIQEETGANIDIDDTGTIKISSVDLDAGNEARRRIEQITADVEVGTIYDGKVAKLMDFGAFVTILPGKDGLVHISQICEERVQNVSDKLSEGDVVKVKVLEVDKQGRIRLSMKAVGQD